MSNILTYKGYHSKIEYSRDDGCLVGEIIGINDLILFEGNTDDIQKHFQEAVDDYLDFCEKSNKEPEKEYSGNFNIRIAPETHKKLKLEAERSNSTLNSIIANVLDEYVNEKCNE